MNEVESVADDDERELVLQLGFLEKVLDLLGVEVIALPTNTFDFPNLTSASGSLDVLEVDLGVCAEVDNGTEIVVETLEGLEALEHLDELDGSQNVRVLGSNLDDHLEVLADVDAQHFLKAGNRLLGGQATKVVDNPLYHTTSLKRDIDKAEIEYVHRQEGC